MLLGLSFKRIGLKVREGFRALFVSALVASFGLAGCANVDLGLDSDSSAPSNSNSPAKEKPAFDGSSNPNMLTGVDGALTVNVAGTVLNRYTRLTNNVAAGATQVRITSTANLTDPTYGALATGDLLLVIQMRGATIDTTNAVAYGNVTALNNAGRYEFVRVTSIASATRVNVNALQYSYTANGNVQVIRVPQLTSLTINSPGTIVAPAWNGTTGGVVALHVQGATTINTAGGIDVSGLGFRGGALENNSSGVGTGILSYRSTADTDGAEKGEGIAGYQTSLDAQGRYGRGAPANGGGGGNGHNAGGGGGANGNDGSTWTGQGYMDSAVTGGTSAWPLDPGYIAAGTYTASSGGGRGGYSYSANNGDALTQAPGNTAAWGGDSRAENGGLGGRPVTNDPAGGRIYMGGGGGAGDANNGPVGGAGGAGGGIVYLISNSVTGTGSILANGANGGNTTGGGNDAPGGAGAGGTVLVKAPLSLTGISISANGGTGGVQTIAGNEAEGPGGGGGGGYISTSTTAITRTADRGASGSTNSGALTEFPVNGSTGGGPGQPNEVFTTFPYGPATNDISVAFTSASQNGAENVGSFTITAQLNNTSTVNVSVPFTLSGTATNGTDYSITASPITITAGSTTANITITVTNDLLDEINETVIVTMGTPTNAIQGTITAHTATINDNDATPSVQFTAASQNAAESSNMTITAQLSAISGQDVTVPFTITGTATGGGVDYTLTSPITITAGNLSASATITVVDDAIDENNETVIATMGVPTNATAGATTVHTATINDNDSPPTVQWTAASQSSVGESGSMTVTAQLSNASAFNVTVPYTVTGTATGSGTDYSITASPITILAGATTGSATITIAADVLDEDNETVIVTMGAPTNASLGATTVHTATITDDDATPTVTWTSASQNGAENVGTFTITAQLSAVSGRTVTIPYTMSGTATGSGTDYSITASPITITAGSTTTNITITVVNDALDEANETVIVTMGSPTNATQGATTVHTATINDNDATPTVTFTSASQNGAESVGTFTVTAQLSAVSGQDVTVPYTLTGTAANPADYTITASPITITAGNTTANITITVTDDSLDENNETVIVTMGSPTNATQGATTVHTATINDNDAAPTVEFTSASQSGAESVGTFTITAQLSAVSSQDVTVPFTLSGTAVDPADYTITASPITITAGNTTQTITITVVDDALDEANETVIVTMGAPTNATQGATTVHTATI
jgi:hypothetical protein